MTTSFIPMRRPKAVVVCIPVYNDWTAVRLLLQRIDAVASSLDDRVGVMLVEDGSDSFELDWLTEPVPHLDEVSVLRLRRNLGHQRAIAIGLAHLYAASTYDLVVVMDGDGEDRPEDMTALLDRCSMLDYERVVFARRTHRSEGFVFRCGYQAYRLVHRLLVGRGIEVGNFSVIPRMALARLVTVAETWNHYAASVYHARIPNDAVPIARGERIAGKSSMNFVALVMHGLSAISVYSDVVGVRLLMFIGTLIALLMAAMSAIVGVRLWTTLAIPGWATNALGLILVSLLNLVVLGTILTVSTLRSRSDYSFLPLRDYRHFVMEHQICQTQPTKSAALSMSAQS